MATGCALSTSSALMASTVPAVAGRPRWVSVASPPVARPSLAPNHIDQLRFDYESQGWCAIPCDLWPDNHVLRQPSFRHELREALVRSVMDREEHFLKRPKPSEVFKQSVREEDPLYTRMRRKYLAAKERHRKRTIARRARMRAKRGEPPIASDDIMRMSQRIAEQLVSLDPARSSIANDPQRLAAINQFQVNSWMTHAHLKRLVHGDFGRDVLGFIARTVGGIASPVLFADRPLVRPMFWRQTAMHFLSPMVGIDRHGTDSTTGSSEPSCAAVWLFLDGSSPDLLSGDARVLTGSHRETMAAIRRKDVDPRMLVMDYPAVEAHTPLWLTRFPTLLTGYPSVPCRPQSGTIVLVHPFLMHMLGANLNFTEHVSVQFFVIDKSSKPNVLLPSWISAWRTSSTNVDFTDPVIFPPLY